MMFLISRMKARTMLWQKLCPDWHLHVRATEPGPVPNAVHRRVQAAGRAVFRSCRDDVRAGRAENPGLRDVPGGAVQARPAQHGNRVPGVPARVDVGARADGLQGRHPVHAGR